MPIEEKELTYKQSRQLHWHGRSELIGSENETRSQPLGAKDHRIYEI